MNITFEQLPYDILLYIKSWLPNRDLLNLMHSFNRPLRENYLNQNQLEAIEQLRSLVIEGESGKALSLSVNRGWNRATSYFFRLLSEEIQEAILESWFQGGKEKAVIRVIKDVPQLDGILWKNKLFWFNINQRILLQALRYSHFTFSEQQQALESLTSDRSSIMLYLLHLRWERMARRYYKYDLSYFTEVRLRAIISTLLEKAKSLSLLMTIIGPEYHSWVFLLRQSPSMFIHCFRNPFTNRISIIQELWRYSISDLPLNSIIYRAMINFFCVGRRNISIRNYETQFIHYIRRIQAAKFKIHYSVLANIGSLTRRPLLQLIEFTLHQDIRNSSIIYARLFRIKDEYSNSIEFQQLLDKVQTLRDSSLIKLKERLINSQKVRLGNFSLSDLEEILSTFLPNSKEYSTINSYLEHARQLREKQCMMREETRQRLNSRAERRRATGK